MNSYICRPQVKRGPLARRHPPMCSEALPLLRLLLLTPTLAALSGTLCAPTSAQEPSSVEADLRADQLKRLGITWDPARPLVWADFLGPPPSTPGLEGALTSSGMLYALQCDRKHLEYGVLTIFEPTESWVKPVVLEEPAQSDRILPHEQGHFDISEIGARLFRADLRTFVVPCVAADTAFATIAQAAFARAQALETRYDEETVHGTVASAQAHWLAWIRATLDSLSFVDSPWTTRKY